MMLVDTAQTVSGKETKDEVSEKSDSDDGDMVIDSEIVK